MKQNSTLLSENAITVALAEAEVENNNFDIIVTDSEDESSDTEMGEDQFSHSSPIRSSLSKPSLLAVQSSLEETKSPSTQTHSQYILSLTLKNGLVQLIHAMSCPIDSCNVLGGLQKP